MSLRDQLKTLDACPDAIEWVGNRDLRIAWAECDRGDWMLWFAGRIGVDRRLIVRAAVLCARTSLHLVPPGEDRPWYATEVALAWCDGRTTLDDVNAANAAAYAAAYATSAASYATSAANAAADAAAYATSAAAATYAADAADAAANATYAASYATSAAYARAASLKQSAAIVRSVIHHEDLERTKP